MRTIKKILCALDLSEHSKVISNYTSMIAKMADASIHVLYVAPTMTQYTGFHVAPNTIDTFVGEIVAGAESAMEKFVKDNFEGFEVTSEIAVGVANEEILECSKRLDADLIIMGTHGRKGIDRILFGSVAEKVLIASTIPVITIRPECAELLENK